MSVMSVMQRIFGKCRCSHSSRITSNIYSDVEAIIIYSRTFSSKTSNDATFESDIKKILSSIKEEVTGKSITALGCLQGISVNETKKQVKIDLDFFVPGYPNADKIRNQCIDSIKHSLDWCKDYLVDVSIVKKKSRSSSSTGSSNLSSISHIIAVSSCKGGVGKSTVAANIALALAARYENKNSNKLRVGILDADIYGPSLHVMMKAEDTTLRRSKSSDKMIDPLIGPYGLKMLSFGHVSPKSGAPGGGGKSAAVMRGPIVSKVINQLISGTDWGDLDYLIIDMPPGTGDVQITISQSLSLSGAVIVTTPHELSLIDASKGIAMFADLNVPTLALVENMSYFTGDDGKVYHPFGIGGREKLMRGMQLFLDNKSSNSSNDSSNNKSSDVLISRLETCPLHSFPLHIDNSGHPSREVGSNEKGPVGYQTAIVSDKKSMISTKYNEIADDVIKELLKLQINALIIPSIVYIESRGILIRYYLPSHALEYTINPSELRIRDPKTGKRLAGIDINEYKGIKPTHFDFKGNYGVAVNWSDGHYADIFPFDILKEIAEDCKAEEDRQMK